MTQPLTDTQHTEQRITEALAAIRREWPHMLPTTAPGQRIGRGSKAAGITADNSPAIHNMTRPDVWRSDHTDNNADVDPHTRLVSLRRHVVEILNEWARLIIDDKILPELRAKNLSQREIDTFLTKILPHGSNTPAMTRFLDRHARWMSGHDAAHDMADELTTLARQILATTQPQQREWISLGDCPLDIETETDDGLAMTTCNGTVRAWPRDEDRDGEVMARCRRCGTEAVASWWEGKMWTDPELRRWLTDDEVANLAHRLYGRPVTREAVRTWVRRGVITATNTDERGRRTFARDAVVYALDLQERRRAT